MYLTTLRLNECNTNGNNNRFAIRRDYNEEEIHKLICYIAGNTQRKKENLLYMRSNAYKDVIYLQSEKRISPDVSLEYGYRIDNETDLSEKYSDLRNGDYVAFIAKLAPTKHGKNSRTHLSIADPSERLEWLKYRFEKSGAAILDANESMVDVICWKHEDNQMTKGDGWVNSYYYRGVAKITDITRFLKNVREGMGRNKAYGCGMIILKKAGA